MRPATLAFKIAGIVLLSLSIAWLLIHELYFTSVMALLCLIGLAYSIYYSHRKSIRRMEQLISNIRYGDLNLSFPVVSPHTEEGRLTEAMNEALTQFRTRLYHAVMSEAETEAWQKLIRVLTHEIMNSIAPIISLSETVTERAATHGMNEKDYDIMLQSMQTIHRRSKGLLDFVENYRKLTRIPTPVMHPFSLLSLFRDIEALLPMEGIDFAYSVKPDVLRLYADRALIEQVLINLLKNAVEACSEATQPQIRLNAFLQENTTVISVRDNGTGIVAEAIDKVFVPFFTTKQGGSGIGLSISRQIMNRHGGTITVASKPEGTEFQLIFTRGNLSGYTFE